MLMGDLDRVDDELEVMARLLDELRQPAQMWAQSLSQAMRALFAGRLEEAEALLERNRELGRRAQTPDVTYEGARVLTLFVLRRLQGRVGELEAPLARYVADYPELIVFRCALAALRCDLGRSDQARETMRAVAGDDLADLSAREEWFFAAGLLAEVCAHLEDHSRAASLYELLLPYGNCNLLNWVEVCAGSASRQLGLLATTMSRWDDAARHFNNAIEMDTRTGARPWLAHTQIDFARMLTARGAAGDRDQARRLVTQACAIYRELGMHTHAERVEPVGPSGHAA